MFKSSMTVTKRIWLLAAVLLTVMVVMGLMTNIESQRVAGRIKRIATVDIVAVATLADMDMMHDGLRSVVYMSLYAVASNDEAKKKAALEDLVVFEKKMKEDLKVLSELEFEENLKNLLQTTAPAVEAYTSKTGEIVNALLVENNAEKAKALLPEFEEKFEALEEGLEKVGDTFQKDSGTFLEDSLALTRQAEFLMYLIVAVGVLVGLGLSWYFVRSVRVALVDIVARLGQEATDVRNSSEAIDKAARSLSSTTTEQAAAIEETVSSMEETSSMLAQTTQSAASAMNMADKGQQEAGRGREVIEKMAAAMEEIKTSNQKLERLIALINDIQTKTRVINDIVFETRLLSFNASIEAARAGVHGKGFAVVAEEVGKLASMSGKAADEIRVLLESSTTEVSEVVRTTQEKVDLGKRVSDECEEVVRAMGKSLESIAEAVRTITTASKEQEAGVKQTNAAMNEMDQTTQQNAQNADQLASQAASLGSGAGALSNTVHELRGLVLGHGALPNSDSEKSARQYRRDSVVENKEVFEQAVNKGGPLVADTSTLGNSQALKIVKSDNSNSSAKPERSDSRWKAAS